LPKPFFFEEGQEYEFTVINRLSLPPDDDIFLVLISPFQTRHLLAEKHYVHYNIMAGQKIKCRIDKINCSGKIYLEPEHPFYKEKQMYDFPVKRAETIVNSSGKPEKMLVVADCWNNDVYVNASGMDTNIKHIKCSVDRIKKAKLYLTPAACMRKQVNYDMDRVYTFLVDCIVTLAEDEEYYVLKDESGNLHYLRKKYYKDYGLIPGSQVCARFTSTPSAYRHYLEPIHPRYKPGNIYEFMYKGIESYINESGEEVKKLIVSDGTGNDYFVNCNDWLQPETLPGQALSCLLKNMRMGRLVLECV